MGMGVRSGRTRAYVIVANMWKTVQHVPDLSDLPANPWPTRVETLPHFYSPSRGFFGSMKEYNQGKGEAAFPEEKHGRCPWGNVSHCGLDRCYVIHVRDLFSAERALLTHVKERQTSIAAWGERSFVS